MMLICNKKHPSHSLKNHAKLRDNRGENVPKEWEMSMQLTLQRNSGTYVTGVSQVN
jgi:hypothetical protein